MNPLDLLVICTLDIPIEQKYDLMRWYVKEEPRASFHPSFKWFTDQNATGIAEMFWKNNDTLRGTNAPR